MRGRKRQLSRGWVFVVCAHFSSPYIFVSLQLLNKGALIEEGMQPFLGVVVAEVLKGCAALALCQPGVLKARRVHNEQGAQGVLAGFQSPEAHMANTR